MSVDAKARIEATPAAPLIPEEILMPSDPLIRSAPLSRPDVERPTLAAVPDAARFTITADAAKDILRAAHLLRSIRGADALQLSDLVEVQWLASKEAPRERDTVLVASEAVTCVVRGDDGVREETAPLYASVSLGPSGALWLQAASPRYDGPVASGYMLTVDEIAAHFDLPVKPPKPTLYITTNDGKFAHIGADDPAAVEAALEDIALAECGEGAVLVQDNSALERDFAEGLIPEGAEDSGRLMISDVKDMAFFDLTMLPATTLPTDDAPGFISDQEMADARAREAEERARIRSGAASVNDEPGFISDRDWGRAREREGMTRPRTRLR